MKLIHLKSSAFLSLCFLIALQCSGSGSDHVDTVIPETASTSYHLEGRVSEASTGDIVCVDTNNSFSCDAGEPAGTVNDQREYDLTVSVFKGTESIVVEAKFDGGFKLPMLSAPGRFAYVSPLTTLVALEAAYGGSQNLAEAVEAIRSRFQLPASSLLIPPAIAPRSFTQAVASGATDSDAAADAIESQEDVRWTTVALRVAIMAPAIVIAAPIVAAYAAQQFIMEGDKQPFTSCVKVFQNTNEEDHDCLCRKYTSWSQYRPTDCPASGLFLKSSLAAVSGPESSAEERVPQEDKFRLISLYRALNVTEFLAKLANARASASGTLSQIWQTIRDKVSQFFSSVYAALTTPQQEILALSSFVETLIREKFIPEITASAIAAAGSDSFSAVARALATNPAHTSGSLVVDFLNINEPMSIRAHFIYPGTVNYEPEGKKVAIFWFDTDERHCTPGPGGVVCVGGEWHFLSTSVTASCTLSGTGGCVAGSVSAELPLPPRHAGHTYLVRFVLLADGSETTGAVTFAAPPL